MLCPTLAIINAQIAIEHPIGYRIFNYSNSIRKLDFDERHIVEHLIYFI